MIWREDLRKALTPISIGLLIGLSGCQPASLINPTIRVPSPTVFPNAVIPTRTSFPTPPRSPSPVPTRSYPVLAGTIVPVPGGVIGVETSSAVTELARWMRGWAVQAVFSPDGAILAVASEIAIHLYDAESLVLIRVIDIPPELSGESNDPYILESGFTGIAFSPDGKTLASTVPNAIGLWDIDTGRKENVLRMDRGNKGSLAFSPDGKRIAAGSSENTVLWDLASGKATNLDLEISDYYELAFSPDGNLMAAGSSEGEIAIWDFAEGKFRYISGRTEDGWVMSLAFSPDGKVLASGSRDTTIKLWDTSSRKKIATLISHEAEVASVAFSPDGETLASGSWDGMLKIWNASTGRVRFTRRLAGMKITGGSTGGVVSVAFSPDGGRLVSATEDFTVQFWDPADGSEHGAIGGPPSEAVTKVVFAPDGKTIAAHSMGGWRLWNSATGKERLTLKAGTALVLLPDGTALTAYKSDESHFSISRLGMENGEVLHRVEMAYFYCNGLAFSPDGKILATSTAGETISLWDTATGELIRRWPDGGYNDGTMVFSPDGRVLASQRVVDEKWTVTLWDTSTGKALHALEGFSSPVRGKAFSPDGKLFASGSYESAILWDVASGEKRYDLETAEWADVVCFSFSPDGMVLAAGSDVIFLWDVSTGEALRTLDGHLYDPIKSSVNSVAFSPDGKLLISASLDGTIRLWGVAPSVTI